MTLTAWGRLRKRVVPLSGVVAGWTLAVLVIGPVMLRAAYHGRGPAVFRRALSGRAGISLEEYLSTYYRMTLTWSGLVIGLVLLITVLVRYGDGIGVRIQGILRRGPVVITVGVMLLVAGLHSWLTWGHVGLQHGDYGVWLHQVDRFAAGGVPYRDFFFQNPPFGLWVVGSLASLVGTDLLPIWLITNVLYVIIILSYVWFLVNLFPDRKLVFWVGVPALILAIPYTAVLSAPLPMGGYTPSWPVGLACLFAMVGTGLRATRDEQLLPCLGAGLLAGLCVLTKQDFWAPALWVVATVTGLRAYRGDRTGAAAVVSAAIGTVVLGAIVVGVTAGFDTLPQITGGFGLAREYGIGRALPSWERLTAEVAAAGFVAGFVALSFVAARVPGRRVRIIGVGAAILAILALTTYYLMTPPGGPPTPRFATKEALQLHLLPMIGLPAVLALILVRWQSFANRPLRDLVIVLLLLAIALRARRGFERVQGVHILMEVPVYVLALELFTGRASRRALAFAAPFVVVAGLYLFKLYEHGRLTGGGRFPAVPTARGVFHPPPQSGFVELGDVLDELDPEKRRPIFAFGHNGGLAYFFERENPTPSTFGLLTSPIPPESTIALVRNTTAPAIVIYVPSYEKIQVARNTISLRRWQQPTRLNHYMARDYPYFEGLRLECPHLRTVAVRGEPFYEVHDCAARADPEAARVGPG